MSLAEASVLREPELILLRPIDGEFVSQDDDLVLKSAYDYRKLSTVRNDWSNSDSKKLTFASGAVFSSVFGVGMAKLPSAVGMSSTLKILEATHSPTLTAAIIAGSYALWTTVVGKSTTSAVKRFPSTSEWVGNKISGVIKGAHNLPGYETEDKKNDNRIRQLGGKAIKFVGRGFTASAISTMIYAGPKAIEGESKDGLRALTNTIPVEAGFTSGLLVYGASLGILKTAQTHPAVAHVIESSIGSFRLDYGLVLGYAALKYADQKIRGREEVPNNIRLNEVSSISSHSIG
jgi:hypothetical protein